MRHSKNITNSVLGSGKSDVTLRKSIYGHIHEDLELQEQPLQTNSGVLNNYLTKVALHPYKIIDRDIEQLKKEGFSEDEIFELTVTTAVASGVGRLNKAMDLLNKLEL